MKIAICICTYQRPYELTRLLQFVKTARLPIDSAIFVIDNDPAQSAETVAENYGVNYAVAPKRGYASVRNVALQTAFSQGYNKVAFIDDDDMPRRDWLFHLTLHDADIVFGGWYTSQHLPKLLRRVYLFDSSGTKVKTKYGVTLPGTMATCNVLISRSVMDVLGPKPFDEMFNESGGEDTELFIRTAKAGLTWAQAPASLIDKIYNDDRLTLRWIFHTGYRHGFLKYSIALRHAPRSKIHKRSRNAVKALVVCCVKLPLFIFSPSRLIRTLFTISQTIGTLHAAGRHRTSMAKKATEERHETHTTISEGSH